MEGSESLRLRLAHVIILMLVCGNIFFFWNAFGQKSKDLRLTCLSVGHGSAIFVEFPNGKNLLFDAGSHALFDVGKSIIAPFLWERGVKKIDLVALSHEHTDHINALPSLMERFRIDTVLTNKFFPQFFYQKTGSHLPEMLKDKGIKHYVVSSGTRINGFGLVELTVLGPPQYIQNQRLTLSSARTRESRHSILSTNDNSCVLRIGYAGRTVLLLGDVQEAGIISLLNNVDNLKADVIQVPHHGLRISNTNKLVNNVQPQYAFINSGAKTVSEKTLNEYLKNGTQVFQTDRSGAITVTINSNGAISVSTFIKQGLLR